jgi:hypothetical protein
VAGEIRRGYWDVQGGEGLIVTEAEWRRTLQRWLGAIRAAQGSDAFGDGRLRIGAISCGRNPQMPAGTCQTVSRVQFTFINAQSADVAQGTGLPGQRTTFHIAIHRGGSGEYRVEGSGTIVPPNSALEDLRLDAIDADGKPFLIQYYPWTP